MASRFFTGKQRSKTLRELAISLCTYQYRDQHLCVHFLTGLSSILNVLAIKVFGEAEFWLSGGKVSFTIMPSNPGQHTDLFLPR
jgi:hypothetical protein